MQELSVDDARIIPDCNRRKLAWNTRFILMMGLVLLGWASSIQAVSYRWSESTLRIYVEGTGSATLSDIKNNLPKVPLSQVSPGIWQLRADLQVADGATLLLHGTKIGGDVNELRMQSNNDPNSTNNIVFISVDWGFMDIRSTKITSWDDAVNGPDTQYLKANRLEIAGRAFIRCRSSIDTNDCKTIHESRMDIVDTEIGYLGSHDPEAYGLVWKVVTPKCDAGYGALTNLYSLLNVYGDILRCHIHNNFFGMYSFGAYGMHMADNELDHNIGYGFDPHDDSDFLIIERNNVHHNGWHGIIASQRCNNLIIQNNVSWANGRNGIMLHRYCDDSLVYNNHCLQNGDSGIAMFDTKRATITNNFCLGNFNAGIRFSVGPADCLVISNEFAYGNNFGLYLYKGIDAPKPGDDGHPKGNRFVNNLVHDNKGSGIFLTTGDNNSFSGNLFYHNTGPFWFINGLANSLESNSIPNDVVVRLQGSPNVPSTLYIRNEPSVTVQVDPYSSVDFEDLSGRIFDSTKSGLYTTVTPTLNNLILTSSELVRPTSVSTVNLSAIPDAGVALMTIVIWNTTGDLSKTWQVQAGSSTHVITYRIGDLDPNRSYAIIKKSASSGPSGVVSRITSDDRGYLTYKDTSIGTGLTEYNLTP